MPIAQVLFASTPAQFHLQRRGNRVRCNTGLNQTVLQAIAKGDTSILYDSFFANGTVSEMGKPRGLLQDAG